MGLSLAHSRYKPIEELFIFFLVFVSLHAWLVRSTKILLAYLIRGHDVEKFVLLLQLSILVLGNIIYELILFDLFLQLAFSPL